MKLNLSLRKKDNQSDLFSTIQHYVDDVVKAGIKIPDWMVLHPDMLEHFKPTERIHGLVLMCTLQNCKVYVDFNLQQDVVVGFI